MCKGAGPCATEPCEPRQVRKEATVSGQFCVPQDHLAPLSLRTPERHRAWKFVIRPDLAQDFRLYTL